MAKIVAFVNQKGGVGKTTTTINVARYLADFGKKVLLVDLDPQGNASSGLGIDPRGLEKNLYHAMIGGLSPREIILSTETDGLHIIPAAQDLAGAEIEMVITVKEFITPPLGALKFFAQTDKQTNQSVAPYTPCGWGTTMLEALSTCIREIHRFPYQSEAGRA